MRALKEMLMVLSMRLYVCWAAGIFCLVLSIGECQADSPDAPLAQRIGRRVMRALDSIFAALFTMNADAVREAYAAARERLNQMDAD